MFSIEAKVDKLEKVNNLKQKVNYLLSHMLNKLRNTLSCLFRLYIITIIKSLVYNLTNK